MNTQLARSVVVVATLLVVVLLFATDGFAQAWTPPQGEGAISIAYQDSFVKYHLFTTTPLDRGHIRSQGLLLDLTYGITDKIALDVGLPYIAAKYNGPYPHPTGLDTGDYHSSFQDFRFGVSYNVTKKGLVFTPFVGTIMPSHGYEYWAHSAVGRNVRELQIGAYWAKLLDPILPGLFVSGRYSYGFAQQILDISHNRSNLDLEVGYFVKPDVRVFAIGSGQLTHGGVDIPLPSAPPLPTLILQHHDQIGRENGLNVGGGAAFSVKPNVDVFGSIVHTVAGRNMHELEYGLTVGVTWSFTTSRASVHSSRVSSQGTQLARFGRGEAETRHLIKCICQKGH